MQRRRQRRLPGRANKALEPSHSGCHGPCFCKAPTSSPTREEPRLHIHVQGPRGEAKFWLEPEVGLAQNYGLSKRNIVLAIRLIREHEDEIRSAWKAHFRG